MKAKKQRLKSHRVVLAGLVAAVAAAALVLVPTALESSTSNGLSAYVVPTNRGPLPPCSGNDCTSANLVVDYIHVANRNPLVNQFGSRLTVPNAFVINSVDVSTTANGVDQPVDDGRFTPPPNVTPFRSASGRWPATVLCDGDPPCTDIQNPAVIPGEDTVGLYVGWVHDTTDQTGNWVFTYTIHGTLNGNPVDLTTSSPPTRFTG